MSYNISCALCPQVFNCPYDKKDGRVVFTKECTGK